MARRRYEIPDSVVDVTDEILLREIPRGSKIIDLGCGDGRLLQKLRTQHDCRTVLGIELDLQKILQAVARGVPVVQADLDEGLKEIPDDTFDVAVLSQTLQEVKRPKDVLVDMMRVARRALVVVPNFAHWRIRLQLAFRGRAPVTRELPYEWYESPNLHVMSMIDFRELAEMLGIRIVKELPIIRDRAVDRAWWPNLRAVSAMYVLERSQKMTQQA